MKFFLRRLKLEYVLEKPCPDAPSSEVATDEATLIKEQIVKLQDDDYLCKNCILGGMSNKYYDQYYIKCKFTKEICDTLKAIYLAEEGSSKKFLVSNYMEFKMVDDKSISKQVQEFQLIAKEASSTKFLVSNYMEFKMIDDKSIFEQVQEFQFIANKIAISEIARDENFHVGAIVSKLLPS
ncbi:hypothetical protein H5410_047310 [Solanum commersonii]|uniref:Uncharacterized protein n=1 Tax=Solanum commersonii TaxID=4109 RepID=A0A9J5XHX3_SOLCO|nr:hypothetical protein H5410_047310 [Solanum commersonii]